jgi:hypothetical protein
MVERAKVILLAHPGKANLEIAKHLKTGPPACRSGGNASPNGGSRVCRMRIARADRLDDQATEKRVLAMLDESPPEGYGKWSGGLLAEALGDVSDDQVWRVLLQA